MKKDNWRQQFDEVCYFLKGRPAEKLIKNFIADLIKWEKTKAKNGVIKEIDRVYKKEKGIHNWLDLREKLSILK